MANEKDELRTTNFDGIQEYDNDLPRWWVWLFYITIIFAAIYVVYRHFGIAKSTDEVLAAQMSEISAVRQAHEKKHAAAPIGEADLLALSANSSVIEKGKAIYAARCVACHGVNAEGSIGPNLTDKHWIHGGKITDLKTVVENGVLEKGMLAWKGVLSADDINAAVAYIWTLRGTNPANAKAPQGELVE